MKMNHTIWWVKCGSHASPTPRKGHWVTDELGIMAPMFLKRKDDDFDEDYMVLKSDR
ncbi:hypothetical protein GJ744_003941 [Endocarpon pusillum]|uniref:Uncharacterized protein n=1 Tax=Endocarpon pusillum TaxID=364733 RepID=A0A8H7AA20_9EURO|nr:hypothetical protein GJ744_003941 [Endocarpon pusillum]